MFSFTDIISQTLTAAAGASPGVFVHGGNTYSGVTRSYGPAESAEFAEFGTMQDTSDASVIIPIASLKTPNPDTEDACTLDGEAFVVGNRITKTVTYWMIPLRKRQ